MDQKEIQQKLKTLIKNAYSPYSKVKVGAIILTKNGQSYFGVNVENASYGATICAERAAFLATITAGVNPRDIASIHIYSNLGKELYPCSLCLQVMAEFLTNSSKIYIYGGKKNITTKLDELLPHKITKDSF